MESLTGRETWVGYHNRDFKSSWEAGMRSTKSIRELALLVLWDTLFSLICLNALLWGGLWELWIKCEPLGDKPLTNKQKDEEVKLYTIIQKPLPVHRPTPLNHIMKLQQTSSLFWFCFYFWWGLFGSLVSHWRQYSSCLGDFWKCMGMFWLSPWLGNTAGILWGRVRDARQGQSCTGKNYHIANANSIPIEKDWAFW